MALPKSLVIGAGDDHFTVTRDRSNDREVYEDSTGSSYIKCYAWKLDASTPPLLTKKEAPSVGDGVYLVTDNDRFDFLVDNGIRVESLGY